MNFTECSVSSYLVHELREYFKLQFHYFILGYVQLVHRFNRRHHGFKET